MKQPLTKSIDGYISDFPADTQKLLEQIRATIRKAAPDAGETISYGIPTFTLKGNLVHFAGYKHHIGFYPGALGIETFQEEISKYTWAKGSVQFPIDKPLPLALITKIVKFRVKRNLEKDLEKSMKTCPKGHKYYKSSDCPTCPTCEQERKPKDGFLSTLSAPARRALENNGISTLKQLSRWRETDVLSFHGMGKSSLTKLRSALEKEGLSFKK